MKIELFCRFILLELFRAQQFFCSFCSVSSCLKQARFDTPRLWILIDCCRRNPLTGLHALNTYWVFPTLWSFMNMIHNIYILKTNITWYLFWKQFKIFHIKLIILTCVFSLKTLEQLWVNVFSYTCHFMIKTDSVHLLWS